MKTKFETWLEKADFCKIYKDETGEYIKFPFRSKKEALELLERNDINQTTKKIIKEVIKDYDEQGLNEIYPVTGLSCEKNKKGLWEIDRNGIW